MTDPLLKTVEEILDHANREKFVTFFGSLREALEMGKQGLNIIAIAQELGVSRNRISGLLSRASLSDE